MIGDRNPKSFVALDGWEYVADTVHASSFSLGICRCSYTGRVSPQQGHLKLFAKATYNLT